jgi:hypothetical protein
LGECVAGLGESLEQVRDVDRVIVASHHLPFRELLPPPRFNNLEFAKAYLGSPRLGEVIVKHANVSRVYCGHSHFPARARIGHLDAINLGGSYRAKTFETVELPD